MRRGYPQTERLHPVPGASAQIIGLLKNRMSGITLSRHAYAEVLRRIYPDLLDSTVDEASQRKCKLNIWAARPLSHRSLDSFRRLPGFNVWCLVVESTVLPERSLEAAENADQVWVPTTFCRDVCVKNGMHAEKVHVVPYFLPSPKRERKRPTTLDPYTVLVSWDGKSNLNRKNVINSIHAFKRLWQGNLDVRLKLKTRDLSEGDSQLVKRAIGRDARILLDDSFLPEVDDLFDGADCLMHCHRAEGYGRHIIEAMQRGLPVIATAYSGPMDWLHEDNAFLVDYKLSETSVSEYRYPQGGQWAEPDFDGMANQLYACFTSSSWANDKAANAKATVAKVCNIERSMQAMLDALTKGGFC